LSTPILLPSQRPLSNAFQPKTGEQIARRLETLFQSTRHAAPPQKRQRLALQQPILPATSSIPGIGKSTPPARPQFAIDPAPILRNNRHHADPISSTTRRPLASHRNPGPS